MPTGTSEFQGLAVPLNGESQITQQTAANDILTITGASGMAADFIVCEDSSGTEIFYLRQDGFMRLNPTTTISAMGFDCRMASSSTTGVNVAGNFRLTHTATGDSAQNYALWAYLDMSSATTGGGRTAVMSLYLAGETSAAGTCRSFINFSGDATGMQIYNLFTFPGFTVDTGPFVALAAADSTHGIRIAIDTAYYYIMCTSCVP
jgi:hypothetical protein